MALALGDRLGAASLDPLVGLLRGCGPSRPWTTRGCRRCPRRPACAARPRRSSPRSRIAVDARRRLGLQPAGGLGAARDRRLAHGLHQAGDERVLATRRGCRRDGADRRARCRASASPPVCGRPRAVRRGPRSHRGWPRPTRLAGRLGGLGSAGLRFHHRGLGSCSGTSDAAGVGVRGHVGGLRMPVRDDGMVPRRDRRLPRPAAGRAVRRRARPCRPRRGRARPPTGGGSRVSAGSTSLDDPRGVVARRTPVSGRWGWSWCGRVRGSAPVVPGRRGRRYRSRCTAPVAVAAGAVEAVRRYPCRACSSPPTTDSAAARLRRPRTAGSTGWAAPLRDLRISVTDRCNFRCPYCMPSEVFGRDYRFLPRDEILELRGDPPARRGVRRARRAASSGSPAASRPCAAACPDLVAMLAALRTPDGEPLDLALTTNGSALRALARPLADAGPAARDGVPRLARRRRLPAHERRRLPGREGARRHRRGGRGGPRRRSRSTSS